MNQVNERLLKGCTDALVALEKLNSKQYNKMQANLEWCIGSYNNDKNPVGIYKYGVESLETLKRVKAKQPRKVNKKVLDGLEKAILNYSKNQQYKFKKT